MASYEKTTDNYIIREADRQKDKIKNASPINLDVSPKLVNAEKKLILLMAENKKYFDIVMKEFSISDFSNKVHISLVEKMQNYYKNSKHLELSMLLNDFSDDSVNYASNIFYNMEEYKDKDEAVFELIKSIKIEKLSEKISKETDAAIIRELVSEISAIKRSRYNG